MCKAIVWLCETLIELCHQHHHHLFFFQTLQIVKLIHDFSTENPWAGGMGKGLLWPKVKFIFHGSFTVDLRQVYFYLSECLKGTVMFCDINVAANKQAQKQLVAKGINGVRTLSNSRLARNVTGALRRKMLQCQDYGKSFWVLFVASQYAIFLLR